MRDLGTGCVSSRVTSTADNPRPVTRGGKSSGNLYLVSPVGNARRGNRSRELLGDLIWGTAPRGTEMLWVSGAAEMLWDEAERV